MANAKTKGTREKKWVFTVLFMLDILELFRLFATEILEFSAVITVKKSFNQFAKF